MCPSLHDTDSQSQAPSSSSLRSAGATSQQFIFGMWQDLSREGCTRIQKDISFFKIKFMGREKLAGKSCPEPIRLTDIFPKDVSNKIEKTLMIFEDLISLLTVVFFIRHCIGRSQMLLWSIFLCTSNPDYVVAEGKMSFESHDAQTWSPRVAMITASIIRQLRLFTCAHPPSALSRQSWRQRIPEMSKIATYIFQKLCCSLAKLCHTS